MGKIEDKDLNPFCGLKPTDDVTKINDQCKKIAEKLFNNYCIKCNGTEYYLAEIEFYYWSKDEWDKDWNKVTYVRDINEAGKLLFHLSGIDICFVGSFNNENPKFGGILIRSIMDKNGNRIIAGPWNSMLHILNTCEGGTMPKFSSATQREVTIQETFRALGEEDLKKDIEGNLKLSFYATKVGDVTIDWTKTTEKISWNKGNNTFKSKTTDYTYKNDRFNDVQSKQRRS